MKGILLFLVCLSAHASSELVKDVYLSLSTEIESIYIKSNNKDKKEYGGIITRDNRGFNFENISKGSSNSISLYYAHSENVKLIGEFHTHPYKYESLKNMPFSPRDFYNLYYYSNGEHLVQNYMSLVKAGEISYAMVVEDPVLAKNFWREQDRISKEKKQYTFDYIYQKYYSRNNGNDIIDIQINSLIYIMNNSGIKLYKIEDDIVELLN